MNLSSQNLCWWVNISQHVNTSNPFFLKWMMPCPFIQHTTSLSAHDPLHTATHLNSNQCVSNRSHMSDTKPLLWLCYARLGSYRFMAHLYRKRVLDTGLTISSLQSPCKAKLTDCWLQLTVYVRTWEVSIFSPNSFQESKNFPKMWNYSFHTDRHISILCSIKMKLVIAML